MEDYRQAEITDPQPVAAPKNLTEILWQIGPGLIIAASIVGSGELIITTKLGADVGFTLLWFIIAGCMIKVSVQIELGRYALAHGHTTLEALNTIPGPRLVLSWMVLIWIAMFIATFFQLAGMIGAIADVFRFGGIQVDGRYVSAGVALSCAVLLAAGRYQVIQGVSTAMVAIFTLFTILAVGALAWTEYPITWSAVRHGFEFQLPEKLTTALAAFGIIGVGASELIYYPYWCLEKGYARAVGPNDGSREWGERARGWMRVLTIDAWVSMVVYTGATVAFYLLGAAVLHGKSLEVTNQTLIPSLSQMYSESFGAVGLWMFLLGSFVVLYSTVFIATASNGRLCADLFRLTRIISHPNSLQYDRLVRYTSTALPLVYLLIFFFVDKPLSLVFVGALAQALMLPLLCGAALYFHHARRDRQLGTSIWWTLFLWISSGLMMSFGVYEMVQQLIQAIRGEP